MWDTAAVWPLSRQIDADLSGHANAQKGAVVQMVVALLNVGDAKDVEGVRGMCRVKICGAGVRARNVLTSQHE